MTRRSALARGSTGSRARRCRLPLLLAVAAIPLAAPAATLVVCAPGYPGSTAEAQPAMDAFAAAVGEAAGWPPNELAAVYFETESGGLARLAEQDAALALLPLPFFLAHAGALRLSPLDQAVVSGGLPSEPWTLVAGSGKLPSPAALAGVELVSLAGYVPRFVRGPALAGWGELPPGVKITSSGAVLSALRRAAAGEPVAVLLDGPQAAAVSTLPFAGKLEVVYRSAPLPVSVLCSVGGRLPPARAAGLVAALERLGSTPSGKEALSALRLDGFVPVDEAALATARTAYAGAHE